MPNIVRFKQLDQEATPAPWYTDSDPDLPRNPNGDVEWPEHLADFAYEWDYYLSKTDAELIVKLRNSFPHFVALIEASRQLLNAWNSDEQSTARAKLNTALQRLEDV